MHVKGHRVLEMSAEGCVKAVAGSGTGQATLRCELDLQTWSEYCGNSSEQAESGLAGVNLRCRWRLLAPRTVSQEGQAAVGERAVLHLALLHLLDLLPVLKGVHLIIVLRIGARPQGLCMSLQQRLHRC